MAEAAFLWKVRMYVVGIDAFVKLCNERGFFVFWYYLAEDGRSCFLVEGTLVYILVDATVVCTPAKCDGCNHL
jgi:hypothetical protein